MLEKFKATHGRGASGVELTTDDSDGMDQALEAKNTLPPSFKTDRRGDFQRPEGLIYSPQSPISNINRIRPAFPLPIGLVQPWVQSESSYLATAKPFNVSPLCW